MTKTDLEKENRNLSAKLDEFEQKEKENEGSIGISEAEYDRIKSFEQRLMDAQDTISECRVREIKQSEVMIELAQGISILAKNHRGNQ